MLAETRRARILADAIEGGGVTLRELSDRFAVSVPTLRRDLCTLADRGLLRRVHGGAMPVAAPVAPRPTALADAVALVEPGMAVGIAGGRPAVDLAALLDGVADLTIVTPVLAVARVVPKEKTVVLVGGSRTPSGSHAGPLTERALRALNLDITFVGGGERDDPLAARTERVLLDRAQTRVRL